MTLDTYTNRELHVDVGDGHTLYVHDWGKKDAVPILFIHGGPGGNVKDRQKQRFDPALQRVIFYDQRGCGASTPYGELQDNTTGKLIADIEKIADALQLKEFIITGGSWGSCLALAYALEHPDRIRSMILQGIFTGSQEEINYLEQGLFRSHFPEVWERVVEQTPPQYQSDPVRFHMERIFGENEPESLASTKLLSEMEGALVSLDDRFSPREIEAFDPVPARIEAHYMRSNCFMPDRHILANAHKLKMPIWLVQGRYDFVCAPAVAYELAKKLPNGHLIWTQAGHGNDRNNYEVMRSLLLQASLKQ